ncbi:hypothetical protein E2C01_095188 [Portunus trituberculatus]|uniref:Uncharacterized protein n=1 Tax=Portunus trituberculatus TaxID=210409 RepID=A0A5B7K540_PORTR|nr:hypothetical protein [Portunus trituberculatus]
MTDGRANGRVGGRVGGGETSSASCLTWQRRVDGAGLAEAAEEGVSHKADYHGGGGVLLEEVTRGCDGSRGAAAGGLWVVCSTPSRPQRWPPEGVVAAGQRESVRGG